MKVQLEQEAVELLRNEKKPCPITVVGQSMHPFLKDGSRLMIAPTPPAQLRIGDIIAFVSHDETLTCHRVVGKFWKDGELFVREKGDCNRKTSTISTQDILGKAVGIEQHGKWISLEGSKQRTIGFGIAIYSQFKLNVARLLKRCDVDRPHS